MHVCKLYLWDFGLRTQGKLSKQETVLKIWKSKNVAYVNTYAHIALTNIL